jgi:hypothetical protein
MREVAGVVLQWGVVLVVFVLLGHRLFIDWFSWICGAGFALSGYFVRREVLHLFRS